MFLRSRIGGLRGHNHLALAFSSLRRLGQTVFEFNALLQLLNRLFCELAFYLHQVGFRLFMFRVGDLVLQFAVVRQQQQASESRSKRPAA